MFGVGTTTEMIPQNWVDVEVEVEDEVDEVEGDDEVEGEDE